MPPGGRVPSNVKFGLFELDVAAGELRKRGQRVPIQGLPLELLAVLLEHPNQVVKREDLRARLWPSDTFVDFDHSLHNAIARLREALGDEASSPRFIETLPRRGYRFIGPIDAAAANDPVPSAAARRGGASRPLILAAVVAMVLLAAIVGLTIRAVRPGSTAPSTSSIRSVAVLPLKNLSVDPEQGYFAEGMTEALITTLGKIGSLRVISRTSVMRFADTRAPLPEIAKELHVDALVEGTVARSGDRVRVTANLVQGSPERHLWAQSYERDLRDVLAIQRDLASAIAREIQITLTPEERSLLASARTVDPDTYQLYLKGRYFWNRRTEPDLKKAVDYFQHAVERDARYAPAYAALADTYVPQGYFDFLPPREAGAKAKAAALRALEIDDTLADAHTSLAATLEFYERDWAGAEREFKRAIALNPNDATTHNWYAQLLAPLGRIDEFVAEGARAEALDPVSIVITFAVGNRLYFARRYASAIDQLQKALELDPNFAIGRMELGRVFEAQGQYERAMHEYQRAVALSDNPSLLAALGRAYAAAGNTTDARQVLSKLAALSQRRYISPLDIARVRAGLGEPDETFTWLDRAFNDGSNRLVFLKLDPDFDPIRADRRFGDLVRRLGLEP